MEGGNVSPLIRISFVGSHCTGKTTLVNWVKKKYQLPSITEIARQVLIETPNVSLPALHQSLEHTTQYQSEVFHRQLNTELSLEGSYVADRAFDSLAYCAEFSNEFTELLQDPMLDRYLERIRNSLVFFTRPCKEFLKADGVRETDWDQINRIDGMIKLLLRQFRIKYVEIKSHINWDRTNLVQTIVDIRFPNRVVLLDKAK